jgi:DNA-binding transcriptional regulator PaaX
MKSANECYSLSERCERTAQRVNDRMDRTILRATARQWRMLAEQAKAKERTETQDPWPSPKSR